MGVRAPKEIRAAALAVLSARGIPLSAFVVACLRAVTATPGSMLKSLKPYWPEPPTKGIRKAMPMKPADEWEFVEVAPGRWERVPKRP